MNDHLAFVLLAGVGLVASILSAVTGFGGAVVLLPVPVAKEKLPGVTFDAAYREPNGSYELRGKDKTGKVREIDIKPDGTVEEVD